MLFRFIFFCPQIFFFHLHVSPGDSETIFLSSPFFCPLSSDDLSTFLLSSKKKRNLSNQYACQACQIVPYNFFFPQKRLKKTRYVLFTGKKNNFTLTPFKFRSHSTSSPLTPRGLWTAGHGMQRVVFVVLVVDERQSSTLPSGHFGGTHAPKMALWQFRLRWVPANPFVSVEVFGYPNQQPTT